MPAATHIEKEGCFTNTERLLQWRDKALDPPGDCRSELWFMHHLFKRVRAHYAGSDGQARLADPEPHLGLLRARANAEPSADDVLREINGYDLTTGELVPGFAELKDDGSTACGCWIYSGVYADGVNQARRREPGDLSKPGGWVSPEWGWAWPANRRVLYSRASADPDGQPWSERKRYVWWDGEKWTGYDVPDFPVDKPPDYVAPDDAEGMDAISGSDPFIMQADGRGWLFSPSGLLDGPLPTHFEPLESPVIEPRSTRTSTRTRRRCAGTARRTRSPRTPIRTGRSSPPPSASPSSTRRAACRAGCRGWRSCSRTCSPRSTPSSRASAGSRTAAG